MIMIMIVPPLAPTAEVLAYQTVFWVFVVGIFCRDENTQD